MKIAVVCAPGIGDALILHIVSHHLSLAGFEVVTHTPHRFGQWLPHFCFGHWIDCDAIFLQHDNSPQAKEIRALDRPVYTFYGSHRIDKHGPLRPEFDFVCDPNRTMVDNAIACLQALFGVSATSENGFQPPKYLIHRRYKKRVVIHRTSGREEKNWPLEKFQQIAKWLQAEGYEPAILPSFPSLEHLASFIYESGFFLGNDSGPGHIASCAKIPYLIIGKDEKHMRHWRPGWGPGEIVVPPKWIPNWKGLRLREKQWKKFITTKMVMNMFRDRVLSN